MAETPGEQDTPPNRFSKKLANLTPYDVIEDWKLGRAEEADRERNQRSLPFELVNDRRVDPADIVASPEEDELMGFQGKVRELFKQAGFSDQELNGDNSVIKSVSIPKGGVLWFEYRPENPEKEWLPNADTLEIFEVREELQPSKLRRIGSLLNPDLKRIEHELIEVGPYGQARYHLSTPKDGSLRVKNEDDAIKMVNAEVSGNNRNNPEMIVSAGRKFLDRVSNIVNPPAKTS